MGRGKVVAFKAGRLGEWHCKLATIIRACRRSISKRSWSYFLARCYRNVLVSADYIVFEKREAEKVSLIVDGGVCKDSHK